MEAGDKSVLGRLQIKTRTHFLSLICEEMPLLHRATVNSILKQVLKQLDDQQILETVKITHNLFLACGTPLPLLVKIFLFSEFTANFISRDSRLRSSRVSFESSWHLGILGS